MGLFLTAASLALFLLLNKYPNKYTDKARQVTKFDSAHSSKVHSITWEGKTGN